MTDSHFVAVHTAANTLEAQIVAGLLESEGIKTIVPGTELNDEFGAAMKMTPTEIVVSRDDLERAKDIIAAWKERPDSQGIGDEGR